MTDRELMQQALDALDLVTDLTSYDDEVYEAIDALRARLAQPEEPDWSAAGFGKPSQREWMERERAVGYREGHQAALKQREWQTLTDEEMFSLWVKCPAETEDRFAFARAIESALREKNT